MAQTSSVSLLTLLLALLFTTSSCVRLPEKELLTKADVPLRPSEVIDLTTSLSKKFGPSRYSTLWEQELTCGWVFAKEGDLYRAITCFRKALIYLNLLPENSVLSQELHNRLRIEAVTGMVASYVFHKKYHHAIEVWENFGNTLNLQGRHEAKWLLIMVVQAFSSSDEYEERAEELASMLPIEDPDRASLLYYLAIRSYSTRPLKYLATQQTAAAEAPPLSQEIETLFQEWAKRRKNPNLAFGLNLIIPGSGYAYLGQFPTAFTALSMNTLFIGACIEFFKAAQPMAGLVTLGLEFGWWGGGALGARLSTREYNHYLWLSMARKYMSDKHLYPEAILWKALQEPTSLHANLAH